MKIAQINAVYGYGSTGVIVEDIEKTIKADGSKPYIVYRSTNKDAKNGYKVGNRFDWAFHAAYTRLFGKQGYASKRATKKLLKWFDSVSPDVIHLHNLHSNYINLPLLLKYCAEKNIKTVLTLHDCWFFTGKCFHFIESNCEKWKVGCDKCPRNKSDVKSLFFDRTKKVFNDKKRLFKNIKDLTVVGCSDWISELAKESAVFAEKKVLTIRNGIDLSVFKPIDCAFRNEHGLNGKFVILGMANKWLDKRNEETVGALIKNLPDDCAIVLVGCNDEQKGRALSDKVIKLGFVRDKGELAKIYSSADVFVNLTLADNLPTVNMESIACGTPVITYNVGGSPELVSEKKTGYIVEKFDVKALTDCINKIKSGVISQAACRKYAEENFDKDKNYNRYLDIYKGLI